MYFKASAQHGIIDFEDSEVQLFNKLILIDKYYLVNSVSSILTPPGEWWGIGVFVIP